MKLKFKNLTEVLAFQLEEMYVAEKNTQKVLPRPMRTISSKKLKSEYKKYLENIGDKRLKLKRIFSYLLVRPIDRKSATVTAILARVKAIAESSTAGALKDIQLLTTLDSMATYKLSVYTSARIFAEQLELRTVTELLGQIISWENETHSALTRIALGRIAKEGLVL